MRLLRCRVHCFLFGGQGLALHTSWSFYKCMLIEDALLQWMIERATLNSSFGSFDVHKAQEMTCKVCYRQSIDSLKYLFFH